MGTTMVGGTLIRKMLEAAGMNTDTTREEKTEMKEYKCKVELSKEYIITAADPTKARMKAAELFMAEATDGTPHELKPLIQIVEVGTEEDDLDWNYEEEEKDEEEDDDTILFYYHYYEENLGIESDPYEFGFEMVADIVEKFRLTPREKAELERKVALLNHYERDTFLLPYAKIEVALLGE
jgi:hypothetical protein